MVELHWYGFFFWTALLLFQWVSYLHGEIGWYAVLTFDVRVPFFKKLWIWKIFCCCQEIKNKSPKALCAEIFKGPKGPCLPRTVLVAQRWVSSALLDVLAHLAWHPAVGIVISAILRDPMVSQIVLDASVQAPDSSSVFLLEASEHWWLIWPLVLSGPALLRAVLGDPHTFNVSDLMSVISLPVQGNICMYVCIYIYICMGYL